jgi:hypothetical protein
MPLVVRVEVLGSVLKLGVSHLIYIGGDSFEAERWTVQLRYFTAW